MREARHVLSPTCRLSFGIAAKGRARSFIFQGACCLIAGPLFRLTLRAEKRASFDAQRCSKTDERRGGFVEIYKCILRELYARTRRVSRGAFTTGAGPELLAVAAKHQLASRNGARLFRRQVRLNNEDDGAAHTHPCTVGVGSFLTRCTYPLSRLHR